MPVHCYSKSLCHRLSSTALLDGGLVVSLLAGLATPAVSEEPLPVSGRPHQDTDKGVTFPLVIELEQLATTHPGFRIDGIDAYDQSGHSVSGAGDVNGDGFADLIVGAYRAATEYSIFVGEAYVVFGKNDGETVDPGNPGDSGFAILGIDGFDHLGRSVSGAGDVNGDGLADVIVGGRNADRGHVVFGKSDGAPVDLSDLGSGGFLIEGSYSLGYSVSGAGDVNGDGLADLIAGSPFSDPGGNANAGSSYVIFGKADVSTVDVTNLGDGGFRIDGIDEGDRSGLNVSGAGDVNGDGLADLIVGADHADPGDVFNAGESYVVFGKTDSNSVDLESPGSAAFRIDGIGERDYAGRGVSGAGDVNGDGLADLIVGAPFADPQSEMNAGESYIVFGRSGGDPVDLENLGSGGFRIEGIDASDLSGRSVSGAGDVNGDGYADLIIGAHAADTMGNTDAGESYVVFGKSDGETVNLGDLGSAGFRIDGIDAYDQSGGSVAGAGDVNGDGLADLIVGADRATGGGNSSAGESYVIFSPLAPPAVPTWKGFAREGDAPPLAIGMTGDGSNDGFPDSRVMIDFVDGMGVGLDNASIVTVTREMLPSKGPSNLPDDALPVRWEITTERTAWTSAELTFRYLDAEVGQRDEMQARIYYSESASGPWTELETTNDPERNRVSSRVSDTGFFTISAPAPESRTMWIID